MQMRNNENESDSIIERLNKNQNIQDIVLDNLETTNLTEVEKNFIKTYSPEKVFIVYGTLAPGSPNFPKVQHIRGVWQEGVVRGKLVSEGWGAEMGYNGFRHTDTAEQAKIKAFVLFSDQLVDNWQMLDEFEGEGYKRILAKYELDNGEMGVGFIYAIKE